VTVDRVLLDSGVWIAARSSEERFNLPALELVLDLERPVAALDLTLYEIANVLGARRNQLRTLAELCRSVERRCKEHIVRVEPSPIESTAEIAVEYNLTSYDAAYVAVARLHDWQLVSTDIKDLVSKGLAVTPDAAV
jgi:predicted nucleic acid-binding protein